MRRLHRTEKLEEWQTEVSSTLNCSQPSLPASCNAPGKLIGIIEHPCNGLGKFKTGEFAEGSGYQIELLDSHSQHVRLFASLEKIAEYGWVSRQNQQWRDVIANTGTKRRSFTI